METPESTRSAAAVAEPPAALSFNTAGPCRPEAHYMLPPLERLPEALELVERQEYFVLHAPRQSGKTTTIEAIARELTRSGQYAALAFSCQSAGAAGDDLDRTQERLLDAIQREARFALPAELQPPAWPHEPADPMAAALTAWAQQCPRPLVLFLDEIDALVGRSLVTVLSQLRTGYGHRPYAFPASVGLCGLRDVRDYKAAAGGDPARLGSMSSFNVAADSFRLGDFAPEDVAALYAQHTERTGQPFTAEAVAYTYELTQGQPWLVNALADEAVRKLGVPRTEAIGTDELDAAKERLIRRRASHLDSLVDKLREPRVQRVLEPLITGEFSDADEAYDDDVGYVRDLGLVAQARPLQVANPIYREVVLRALGSRIEDRLTVDPRSFVGPDGRLDFEALLSAFVDFWKQHGEVMVRQESYHEAATHLVVMAFLHRVVNGGGLIDREYGVGRGRLDLCVRWPYQDEDGLREVQVEAMEVKVRRDGRPDPVGEGLVQLDEYLERLDLRRGTLLIFDRRSDAPPLPGRARVGVEHSPDGRLVSIIRL